MIYRNTINGIKLFSGVKVLGKTISENYLKRSVLHRFLV